MLAHPDDMARFTSIKKNKKDHNWGISIYAIADGYETKDKMIPSLTTYQIKIRNCKGETIPFG